MKLVMSFGGGSDDDDDGGGTERDFVPIPGGKLVTRRHESS